VAEKVEKKKLLCVIECTWCQDARQTEIHTAEQQVPEPSALRL